MLERRLRLVDVDKGTAEEVVSGGGGGTAGEEVEDPSSLGAEVEVEVEVE